MEDGRSSAGVNAPTLSKVGRRHLPATVKLPESGIYVFESHHALDFQMPTGIWPFAKICWVPMGRSQLEAGSIQVPLQTNDIVVVPADLPHRFVDDPSAPATLVMVCLAPSVVADRPAWRALYENLTRRTAAPRPLQARNGFHLNTIRSHFRQMVREQSRKEVGWALQLEGHLAQLLVDLMRGTHGAVPSSQFHDAVMEEVLEYLDAHFAEPHSLGELAARCGLSARRFTDRFRACAGHTLTEYLNRKRIAFACERLRETGHIAYACHEAGFQDMAYFYRTFKRYTGTTPGAAANGISAAIPPATPQI